MVLILGMLQKPSFQFGDNLMGPKNKLIHFQLILLPSDMWNRYVHLILKTSANPLQTQRVELRN